MFLVIFDRYFADGDSTFDELRHPLRIVPYPNTNPVVVFLNSGSGGGQGMCSCNVRACVYVCVCGGRVDSTKIVLNNTIFSLGGFFFFYAGTFLLRKFSYMLNPRQVFDLQRQPPLIAYVLVFIELECAKAILCLMIYLYFRRLFPMPYAFAGCSNT